MTLSYLLVYSFVIFYDSVMVLRTMGFNGAFEGSIQRIECRPEVFCYVINWYDLSMLINSNMNPLIHFLFGQELKLTVSRRISTLSRRVSTAYNNGRKSVGSAGGQSLIEMRGLGDQNAVIPVLQNGYNCGTRRERSVVYTRRRSGCANNLNCNRPTRSRTRSN